MKENMPFEQFVHAVASETLENVPAGQVTHALVSASERAPAGHDAHALAPANEYVPVGQPMQAVEEVAPTAMEYVPGAQLLHPPLAQNLPASQRMHLDDARYDPGVHQHVERAFEFVSNEFDVFAGHAVHVGVPPVMYRTGTTNPAFILQEDPVINLKKIYRP
jgi:hypothetical protein